MKMTMHIDEALLAEVMLATGATSKTGAVDAALRKVATKFRQRERWKNGLGLSPAEIGASYDADLAEGKSPGLAMVAEKGAKYGRKRSR